MTIAIVGGGLAGGTTAVELRESGYDGHVVLYAAEPHLPYERPGLSKGVLLGNDDEDSLLVKPADWYREHDIDVRTATPVRAIRPEDHLLATDAGQSRYDQLVLATGAKVRRLAVADGSGRPVAYLRTIEHCRRLKESFADTPDVVVIGAGWIGLEVAAAARSAGCEVTVFEMADLPLVNILGPQVAQVFADLHRAHGVDLRLGASVTEDDLTDAGLVVVGVGVEPDLELAQEAGLEIADGGVLVDAQLRTSDPDVYAIGDIANHAHPTLGHRVRVEHWDTAINQGRTAAHNILGEDEAYERQPYFFTDQYDFGMEYVGHVGPDGYDEVQLEGDTGGAFRAFWVKDGTVVAAMHANDWDASDAIKESIGTRR